MASFDYQLHPVVGALSINESSGHGYIKVCGYLEGAVFHRLSDSEAESIFAPNGEVFAANIRRNYYGMKNSLISMYVMPNTKEGGKNAYVWDWDGEVEFAGTKIIKLEEDLGEDGEQNYRILEKQDLLGKDQDVFFYYGDRLFFIKAGSDSRLIPFTKFNGNPSVVGFRNSFYYIGPSLKTSEGTIDITTDSQLVDWFLRTITTEWEDIQKGSGKAALRAAKDALEAMKALPANVAESRIHRLQTMTESYVFTRDHLRDIASAPWLKPSLDAAVLAFKEDYMDAVLRDNKDELERIKAKHQEDLNQEIAEYNRKVVDFHKQKADIEANLRKDVDALQQELEEKRRELNTLQEKASKAEENLAAVETAVSRIEERKESIVADFQVIRDVLGIAGAKPSAQYERQGNDGLQLHYALSDRRLPVYKGYEKNLETCLKAYHVSGISTSELSNLHARYNVLVLPNIQLAMSLVTAAGRACCTTIFVSVAWKSFDDLWGTGLRSIVKHCSEDKDTIHYLIVRNINLSSLSNYLQPLADLQGGFIPSFPGTTMAFPRNLRILLTVSSEELLPMPKDLLRVFGCAQRDVDVSSWDPVCLPEGALIGYLDTELLSEASKEITSTVNHYQDYLDE